MYSVQDDGGFPLRRVSPFGYPRFVDCVRLLAAFRRFLRPSSALYAKTSAVRSSLFNHFPRFLLSCFQELLTASSVNLSTSTERLLSVFPVCYPVFKELPLSDLFDPSKPVRNFHTSLIRDFLSP